MYSEFVWQHLTSCWSVIKTGNSSTLVFTSQFGLAMKLDNTTLFTIGGPVATMNRAPLQNYSYNQFVSEIAFTIEDLMVEVV